MPSPFASPGGDAIAALLIRLSAIDEPRPSGLSVVQQQLQELMHFTGSPAGFIADIDTTTGEAPQLHTVGDLRWPSARQAQQAEGLWSQVLGEQRAVVYNHLPEGRHAEVTHFMGLPLRCGGIQVGMVGLANREGGYSDAWFEPMQPALAIIGSLLSAMQCQRSHRLAVEALNTARETLRNSEDHYHQMFEAAGVGIARVSLSGRMLEVNHRFTEITGRSREQLEQLNRQDITHPDDLSTDEALSSAALEGQHSRYTHEKRYVRPDGQVVWVMLTVALVRDALGRAQHFVSVCEDISERRRMEDAMTSAKAAERANKAKTDFLSRMSHELRTPLNAMLGFAQLLRVDPGNPINEVQRKKVGHIERAGAHLLAMLTDVLDLSRIEAGGLPLTLEPLRLSTVLDEATALVSNLVTQADLQLLLTPLDEDLYLKADPVRLRQIIVNLLSNAIKYNRPSGRVMLEAQAVSSYVVISITDTGPGLSNEQQAHLFEPFNRLGAERTSVEGTGIGLVIVKRLIDLMRGRIEVSSQPGIGSSFRVWLPAALNPNPLMADPASGETRAMVRTSGWGGLDDGLAPDTLTVLYAEDNAINVELVRQVMRMRPRWQLEVARCGAEAIEMGRSDPPDLLLLDMHLGDMSGLDVSDALEHSASTAGIPRVALSADAMPDQIGAARQRGFLDYLTKPLDVDRLLKLLDVCAKQMDEAPEPVTNSDR
ncbi:MAG: ATP-binding protein [Pseudomonadota bacterium]